MAGIGLLCAFWIGVTLYRYVVERRRLRCDACRVNAMNGSAVDVWRVHTCSRRRGLYRDESTNTTYEFGERKGKRA